MSDPPHRSTDPADRSPYAVDFDVAHPSRLLSYLAGGGSHFAADREVAEDVADALPGGIDTARASIRALGAYVRRTARYLAAEVGIRQFVVLGAAPPSVKNLDDMVRETAPDVRFVYVSDDPVVLAGSHALLQGAPEGAVAFIHSTVPDLPGILRHSTHTLDLAEPVAVLFVVSLSFVPDELEPHAVVAELVSMTASGSHFVVTYPSFDIAAAGMPEAAKRLDKGLKSPWIVRSRDDIARFFDGLDMVEPGLVPIEEWRPDPGMSPAPDRRPIPLFAGVGRKP
jgi:S-adenosyl methyltransferase